MLKLIAEYQQFRYHLLLVDEFDSVDEWPAGVESFCLFIYLDREFKNGSEANRIRNFIRSALLAGATIICGGGLMSEWLHEEFDEEIVDIKLGLDPDVESKDIFPEEYFVATNLLSSRDLDELVSYFMLEGNSGKYPVDKIAVFEKDDPNKSLFLNSLEKWMSEGFGEY